MPIILKLAALFLSSQPSSPPERPAPFPRAGAASEQRGLASMQQRDEAIIDPFANEGTEGLLAQ